ncbi:MAG: ubiquinone biosynthesis protein UbiB [Candidatus Pelagibacter sp.]|nr:ubiquinone biosynthesis protein UbiB [Candidatus Pelagibacter sp.]|tara:strand:- start:946 stop:2037 length:1092 start_codon:yes stop_codon:yes gene_type:complete
MNICIIGDGLSSLALSKNLVNKKIKVFLYYKKIKKKYQNQTLGISKYNYDFFNEEITNLKKGTSWNIKQIEIYLEKYKNEKILSINKSNEDLFCIVKINDIYKLLERSLKKNKFFKKILIKNNNFYKKILDDKKYDLIINCEFKNKINTNFIYSKINKSYKSYAFTTIIDHTKINNRKAIQIFTKLGPIAFLPISNFQTSIVYSINDNKKILDDSEFIKLINQYNKNYKIRNYGNVEKFDLNFSVPRNYYYKNLMIFGDLLHRIHPLAGQGFNMTIRDIKILSKILQDRINLGLPIDSTVCIDFQNKSKHLNFVFSSGIDWIYEFFKFDSNIKSNYSKKFFKIINKNKFLLNFFEKFANKGFF